MWSTIAITIINIALVTAFTVTKDSRDPDKLLCFVVYRSCNFSSRPNRVRVTITHCNQTVDNLLHELEVGYLANQFESTQAHVDREQD